MTKLTSFQKAALSYDNHISLTANAGSGKTTVLANRYVDILFNENIPISSVVAITFTDKAASELYSKIVKEVERRISETSGLEKQKLEKIRRGLVSARISTIHSFCIDILKDFAPEAGVDANFSPIDSRISDEILMQCLDDTISRGLKENRENIKNLMRIFGNRSLLINKIKQIFNKRKTSELIFNSVYKKENQKIADFFNISFEELLVELFNNTIDKILRNISLINDLAKQKAESSKVLDVEGALEQMKKSKSLTQKLIKLNQIKIEILTTSNTLVKRGYLSPKDFEENKRIIEETEDLLREISGIEIDDSYEEYHQDLAKFGKQIAELCNKINELYTDRKQLLSVLDFEDLLLLTHQLLLNDKVKEQLSKKFNYIMIDEYQDTNELQYKIFMPILNDLKSGNLFIVGDEKQSIYMFREAEVALFDRTKAEINAVSKKIGLMNLPHSFRLAPNIAQFVNMLFKELFSSPNPRFNEVKHDELVCAYTGDERGKVEFLISSGEENDEAELIAKKVIQLTEGEYQANYNFSDITILCTKRKNFSDLEKIFSKLNIPFNIVGGKGFYQQQLISDFYNYLSFIVNPKNDLALACILRAPFYGFSDVELMEITLKRGDSLYEKIEQIPKFKAVTDMISMHLDQSKSLSTNELIRKIANDTAYWTYIGNKENSYQEKANLEKLIESALKIDEQGFNTLYDFTSFLKDAMDNQEDEGQAEIENMSNAVKIMTVHQSKGLEFKVVIIYKTNQRSFNEQLKSKDIYLDKEFGILAKLPSNGKYFESYKQAPIVGIHNYLLQKKSLAEYKRLLYVALTRAEERLIISFNGQISKLSKGSFAEMIFSIFRFNNEQSYIELSDNLKIMKYEDDDYRVIDEYLNQRIPIVRKILNKSDLRIASVNNIDPVEIHCDLIDSCEKNEIISASKISLFLNCPKKYALTYEYGYGELTKLFLRQADIELNNKEDDINQYGSLLGNILHVLLEKDIELNKVDREVEKMVFADTSTLAITQFDISKIIETAKEILDRFYKSDFYSKLGDYDLCYNEIEFYKRENDYYLYGIIDKLIFNGNTLIIVDYKSDIINTKNYNEKIKTYTNQLYFYAYLVSSRYPQIRKFELRLLFLRNDQYSTSIYVNRSEIESFSKVIRSTVDKIRRKEFDENSEGCSNMEYYLLN